MFGILLAGASSGINEVTDSIGKYAMRRKAAGLYTLGFLSSLCSFVFLFTLGVVTHDLHFTTASFPTFIPRVFLEILQAHLMILAVVRSDRGDFGLVRTITVPLLLIVDILLGYQLSTHQLIGIFIIFTSVLILFVSERRRIRAPFILLATGLNAVFTLSLFKYDITHYNSMPAEQSLIIAAVLIYFYIRAQQQDEHPLLHLRRPFLALMSVSGGFADALAAFPYVFLPASVANTALRGFAVFFSTLSGKLYFREKNFGLRLALFCGVCLGLILLTQ